MRISPVGQQPVVLHRFLRQAVAEYRVIPTLCAPRSGNQKGSVERLVGFCKNSFLRVRRFRDLDDLQAQLTEWRHEVNHLRPSDATGRIPAEALFEEATARHLGAPATLLVRRDRIDIHVGDTHCSHLREDGTGEVRRLSEHRQEVLAVLHGRRKLATFRRQCLLELGQPAWQFLGRLVHACPDGRWEKPCSELYELLCAHGDGAMLDAMTRCVGRQTCTVAAVCQVLREAA